MPILQLSTNVDLGTETRSALLEDLACTVAVILGKAFGDVMVFWHSGSAFMAGKPGAVALVELQALHAFPAESCQQLCLALADVLQDQLGLDGSRIYFHYTAVSAPAAWRIVDGRPLCHAEASP